MIHNKIVFFITEKPRDGRMPLLRAPSPPQVAIPPIKVRLQFMQAIVLLICSLCSVLNTIDTKWFLWFRQRTSMLLRRLLLVRPRCGLNWREGLQKRGLCWGENHLQDATGNFWPQAQKPENLVGQHLESLIHHEILFKGKHLCFDILPSINCFTSNSLYSPDFWFVISLVMFLLYHLLIDESLLIDIGFHGITGIVVFY